MTIGSRRWDVRLAQVAGLAVAAGLVLPAWWVLRGGHPEIWGAPVALGLGWFLRHRPSILVVLIFVLVSFSGTLTAFAEVRPAQTVNVLLAALWAAAALVWLHGEQRRRVWLWPAMVAPLAYLLLTAAAVTLTEPISLGVESFRQQGWYMLAVPLLAFGPWPSREREQMVRGIVAVVLVAGVYIVYRWLVGFSPSEVAQARAVLDGLPILEQPRFFGTFETANGLALWSTTAFAFLFSLAMRWRGRWAAAAGLAAAGSGFAALASDVRIAAVAIVCVAALLLAATMFARSTPPRARPRIAAAIVAAPLAVILATSVILVDNPNAGTRLAALFDPSNDISYIERADRWGDAVERIEDGPALGYGLGTQGIVALLENPVGPVGAAGLDSSYLKVTIEQGVPLAALLFGGLALLAVGLVRGGAVVTSPGASALALGAGGVVLALLILFISSTYVEGLTILPAWILVGLGVAVVTERRGADATPPLTMSTR